LPSVYAVDPRKISTDALMAEMDMNEGFDVGLEMSGSEAAFTDMVEHMDNGGRIALLGIHSKKTYINWDKVVFGGLTIQGIYGREMFDTWYKMMSMLQTGLDVERVITHRFDYSEFEKGFEAMQSGLSGKVVLNWAKPSVLENSHCHPER
jgi:threonine 3-dehydrogenase